MSGRPLLPAGLPVPVPATDGLDAPFWEALAEHRVALQRCSACKRFQWGPEWICHRCLSFDMEWDDVEPRGRIFSWERVWHPPHPALRNACPYVVVLVELDRADGVRLVGGFDGDPMSAIAIGDSVTGTFEDHLDAGAQFTLLHWRLAAE